MAATATLVVGVAVLTGDRAAEGEDERDGGAREAEVAAPGPGDGVVVPPASRPAACPPAPTAPACRLVPLAPAGSGAGATVVGEAALLTVVADAVVASDLADGAARWRHVPFDGGTPAAIVADDRTVLVTGPGAIARLDLSAGSPVWETPVGAGDAAAPRVWLLGDGILSLDAEGVVRSIDRDSGAVRWSLPGFEATVDATPSGLLLRRGTSLGAWGPEAAEPLWLRSDTAGHARELPPGSILGVLDDATQLDPATGDVLTRTPGSVELRDELPPQLARVAIRWEDGGTEAIVQATSASVQAAWTTAPMVLPCCSARSVPADGARLALASPAGAGVVLDVASGEVIAALDGPGALIGVVGDLAVWASADEVVVRRVPDGAAVFRSDGRVLSLEPLVVDGPQGVVHVLWNAATTSQPPQSRDRNRDG